MVFTNFRKTIAIDLSSVPIALSRQDLARLLLDKFKDIVVKAIQFVPVKIVHVTFDDCATRDYYIHSEHIDIEGVNCRIRAAGTQAQQVLIYHYPFEADDTQLRLSLSAFGKVLEVRHQHYVGFNSVCTGTRIVRMDRENAIPRNISVNGHRVKTWYVGQPLECDICRGGGHIAQNCPERGRCRNCRELGHLARDCTNRPNAWQSVNQSVDIPSVPSDPTPAEAARASCVSSLAERVLSASVSSGIGAALVGGGDLDWEAQMVLADNELSPLSASESDTSLGSHVSPSLIMTGHTDMDNDSSEKNVNDGNEIYTIDSNGMNSNDRGMNSNDRNGSDKSISNNVISYTNSNENDDNGNLSQDDYSSSQSILKDQTESNVKDVDITMDVSLLGKRAISEVARDGEPSGKGAAPAPKKGAGSRSRKAASSEVKKASTESRKAASSESARKPSGLSSSSRRSC